MYGVFFTQDVSHKRWYFVSTICVTLSQERLKSEIQYGSFLQVTWW